MTGKEFKSLSIQAVLVGAAAGNISAAPFIGQGSVIWFAFVLLMFVAMAATMLSFKQLFLIALLSLPVIYLWQSVHKFEPPPFFVLIQFSCVVLSSQVAGGLVRGYRGLRSR